MNYQAHYDRLIARSIGRDVLGYFENHHVIPKCLGGSDDASNLVSLTAREHYVAHQLLVKLHPGNLKLIRAANMMTVGKSGSRNTNRSYAWLKGLRSYALSEWSKSAWLDPAYREAVVSGAKLYWSDPKNRERQSVAAKRTSALKSEVAKRSNVARMKPKPVKVPRARGPQSESARLAVSEAKRKWWADKRASDGYIKACSNIAKGTKLAMQDQTIRNKISTAMRKSAQP